MTRKIIPASVGKLGFVAYAKEFGDTRALRRILSLMREANCRTIVEESTTWSELCEKDRNCTQRFQSCYSYVKNLQHYGLRLQEKKCSKLYFFQGSFSEEEDIQKNMDSFLGFCVIHQDKIDNGKSRQEPLCYVAESCLLPPFEKERSFVFGSHKIPLHIGDIDFNAEGNYFAQQNSITNCCAHAAIKMAIRGYQPDLTAEAINECLGIDHIKRKAFKGLTAGEICKAIEKLSPYQTYLIMDKDLDSPSDFLKLVYLSLESRFPVILLFLMPSENPNEFSGHAVTLIGHTFEKHNWWSYGLRGYFASEIGKYLPSSMWCDNFIIQDDNLGPYYLLPVRFLTDNVGFAEVLYSLENSTMVPFSGSLKQSWLDEPMFAILVHPPEMQFLQYSIYVEPQAITKLNQFIDFLKDKGLCPKTMGFETYFLKYQQEGDLILRTFVISREDYLNQLKEQKLVFDSREKLQEYLPETFWITEISIPELFWINQNKVGEIITDPEGVGSSDFDTVSLIRLPNIVGFIEKNEMTILYIEQKDIHHPLIQPKELC